MIVWMAVTRDRYELPLAVENSKADLRHFRGCRRVMVRIEETEEELWERRREINAARKRAGLPAMKWMGDA